MLALRLRRWSNIRPSPGQHLVLAGVVFYGGSLSPLTKPAYPTDNNASLKAAQQMAALYIADSSHWQFVLSHGSLGRTVLQSIVV